MKMAFGSAILEAACRLLVPFILLFAIYVIAHGHDSPGGGFQGGTLLAATIILIRLVHGQGHTWGLDRIRALQVACLGLTLYASIGLASFVCGGNYLDYGVWPLPLAAPHLRALGILGIEIGVALNVMGVLVLIFDALTAWGEE